VARGILPAAQDLIPRRQAVSVVLAAEGYPYHPVKGQRIHIHTQPDALIFHAATRRDGSDWIADGGRVLTIVGLGESLEQARRAAYRQVFAVDFPQSRYRADIAAPFG
ncbi:MAG: phosphoribosylamine--glycine ligase, partial [Firmicutes bacterium]|nr:phosphoribosylamine--glycine ligase [Bacillota bacterium]